MILAATMVWRFESLVKITWSWAFSSTVMLLVVSSAMISQDSYLTNLARESVLVKRSNLRQWNSRRSFDRVQLVWI